MFAFKDSGYIYLQKNILKSDQKYLTFNFNTPKMFRSNFLFLNTKGWPEKPSVSYRVTIIHKLLSFSYSLKGDQRQFQHTSVWQELIFQFSNIKYWPKFYPQSLTHYRVTRLSAHKAVITSGHLSNSRDYLWSSLIQQ